MLSYVSMDIKETQSFFICSFSLPKLHFPSVPSDHWVLACANPLFGTMNLIDPACNTSESEQETLLQNLVFLNTVFKGPHIFYCF